LIIETVETVTKLLFISLIHGFKGLLHNPVCLAGIVSASVFIQKKTLKRVQGGYKGQKVLLK
jgi:hypothetical protein